MHVLTAVMNRSTQRYTCMATVATASTQPHAACAVPLAGRGVEHCIQRVALHALQDGKALVEPPLQQVVASAGQVAVEVRRHLHHLCG